MHALVICNQEKLENEFLKKINMEKIRIYSKEEWMTYAFRDTKEFMQFTQKGERLDLLYMDATKRDGLTCVERVRREDDKACIVLIIDDSVSIQQIVRPSVKADDLIVRPMNLSQAVMTVDRIWDSYASQYMKREDIFHFEVEKESRQVPYGAIWWFEIFKKDLYLHVEHEKYVFKGTMQGLEADLPDMFLRIHRSLIVNLRKIQSVSLGESKLTLYNGVELPIGRLYKNAVKERLDCINFE